MNPKDSSDVTVEALLALRDDSEALRRITEKLRVKQMGPADHIRTKHEAKAFIASGEVAAAKKLILDAQARVTEQQRRSETMSQRQGLRRDP